jgi:hypothetical protein
MPASVAQSIRPTMITKQIIIYNKNVKELLENIEASTSNK